MAKGPNKMKQADKWRETMDPLHQIVSQTKLQTRYLSLLNF